MNKHEAGLGVHAKVINVHDGDTVTVEVRFQLPIRIRNLWCRELKDGADGQSDKLALQELLPNESSCLVFVPSNNPLLLMDAVSLGRVLADIINQDGVDVAEKMTQDGDGFATKKELDNYYKLKGTK